MHLDVQYLPLSTTLSDPREVQASVMAHTALDAITSLAWFDSFGMLSARLEAPAHSIAVNWCLVCRWIDVLVRHCIYQEETLQNADRQSFLMTLSRVIWLATYGQPKLFTKDIIIPITRLWLSITKSRSLFGYATSIMPPLGTFLDLLHHGVCRIFEAQTSNDYDADRMLVLGRTLFDDHKEEFLAAASRGTRGDFVACNEINLSSPIQRLCHE